MFYIQIVVSIFITNLYATGSLNMDELSHIQYSQGGSDITGFAQDGREFAVMGLTGNDAAAFVDITDPYNPFEIGRISGTPSTWRDMKYWDRHVYIGTEAYDGVKVVSVDDPDNPTLVYTINDFGNSHNVHIDKDGYLYVVGASTYDMWIYSLDNPANPVLVGTWNGEYLHDIEVFNNKVYGAAIYSGLFYIIDVADKTNPQTLVSYDTGGGYISTHDCAVTDDEQYLITADEKAGGYVKIWDISDYNNINLVSEYLAPGAETHSMHNAYVRPNTGLLILSYYVDGTRVVDISDPTNPVEIAYFDPTDATGLYDGNWGTYAYLPSGRIISSFRELGLYVLSLNFIQIDHTPIVNQSYTGEDINVSAVISSYTSTISSASLYYNIGSGWNTSKMYNSGSLENLWTGSIPEVENGTEVLYYIEAIDSEGQSNTYPTGAPGNSLSFIVGDLASFEISTPQIMDEDGDGIFNPGESASIEVTILNTGTAEYDGTVYVEIFSLSNYLDLYAVSASNGINNQLNLSFDAFANKNTPLGTSANYTIEVSVDDCEGAGCPQTVTKEFTLTIGLEIDEELVVPFGLGAELTNSGIELDWANPLDCTEGYVLDCALDGDCCPEGWIGDGFADCQDQAYGCDLTCYENDGGDCGATATCEDEGLITCWDGSCVENSSECTDEPACELGYVEDCVDADCCPESWIGDGFADCQDQAYGCDLTCYENDGGDCDVKSNKKTNINKEHTTYSRLEISQSYNRSGVVEQAYYSENQNLDNLRQMGLIGFNVYRAIDFSPTLGDFLAFTSEPMYFDSDVYDVGEYCYAVNLVYDASMSLLSDEVCVLVESSAEIGDLNIDGTINILDIVMLVNFIIEQDLPSSTEFNAADLNDDEQLNILDIVILVNIILE